MNGPKLAILVADEDQHARKVLSDHLSGMRRRGVFQFAAPEEAAVILVLLSSRLVANDALVDQVARAKKRGARVLPIRFDACDFTDVLTSMPAGPRDGWIASASGGRAAELWVKVADDVALSLRMEAEATVPAG